MVNSLKTTASPLSDPDKASNLEALRRQFDGTPYPWIPLDQNIETSPSIFHEHSIATAFYGRDHRLIETTGMTVLDVGCGSGYKALALAHVNPGTTVVGIDLSPKSIELAKQRAEFWGLGDRLEFHVLDVEHLGRLEQQFDYINCDETLYLLPDPLGSLKTISQVLAPQGILRANLHNYHQRQRILNSQKACRMLDPETAPNSQDAIDNFFDLVQYLSPQTSIRQSWAKFDPRLSQEQKTELVQANFLLQGDRGFTIADTFALLDQES